MATGGFSPDARSLETSARGRSGSRRLHDDRRHQLRPLVARLLPQPRALRRDDEFRLYLGLLLVASAAMARDLYLSDRFGLHDSIRHGLFQVSRR